MAEVYIYVNNYVNVYAPIKCFHGFDVYYLILGLAKCLTFWVHCVSTMKEDIPTEKNSEQENVTLCARLLVRQQSLAGSREIAVVGIRGEQTSKENLAEREGRGSEFERIQVHIQPAPVFFDYNLPSSIEIVLQPEQTLLALYATHMDWNKLTAFEGLISIDDVQLQDTQCAIPSKAYAPYNPDTMNVTWGAMGGKRRGSGSYEVLILVYVICMAVFILVLAIISMLTLGLLHWCPCAKRGNQTVRGRVRNPETPEEQSERQRDRYDPTGEDLELL